MGRPGSQTPGLGLQRGSGPLSILGSEGLGHQGLGNMSGWLHFSGELVAMQYS